MLEKKKAVVLQNNLLNSFPIKINSETDYRTIWKSEVDKLY